MTAELRLRFHRGRSHAAAAEVQRGARSLDLDVDVVATDDATVTLRGEHDDVLRVAALLHLAGYLR